MSAGTAAAGADSGRATASKAVRRQAMTVKLPGWHDGGGERRVRSFASELHPPLITAGDLAAVMHPLPLVSALALALAGALPAAAAAQAPGIGAPTEIPPQEEGAAGAPGLSPPRPAGPTLPRGGMRLLPDFRLVSFYGHAVTPTLGILGRGTPDGSVARLRTAAARFARPGRPVLPTIELLASVATRSPGGDGRHRKRLDAFTVGQWVQRARRTKSYLVLEVQGGRDDFLTEAKAFEQFLRQPGVGLGLDPEWRVRPRGVPGRDRGSVGAAEVNGVARYLDGLVATGPQKLLLVHRFTVAMVRDDRRLRTPDDDVALLVNVDAIGTPAAKRRTYRRLARRLPGIPHGLMLFDRLDRGGLLAPDSVLALRPAPQLVAYQ